LSVTDPRARSVVWTTLVVTELALAVGVGAGSATATLLASGMLVLFALLLVGAILGGRAGEPCPCFGAHSVVGWRAVALNIGFAAAFAALALAL
jgi:hypothetical protein